RRPGGGRRRGYARRLLRNVDDPHGGQLQPRPGGAARAQGSIWSGESTGGDSPAAPRAKPAHHLFRGVPMKLDAAQASHMARIALGHVRREYPHKLDHVLLGDENALPPSKLHPIFYGSFDWHSCVHGWWTLLTLRRLFPQIEEAEAI